MWRIGVMVCEAEMVEPFRGHLSPKVDKGGTQQGGARPATAASNREEWGRGEGWSGGWEASGLRLLLFLVTLTPRVE